MALWGGISCLGGIDLWYKKAAHVLRQQFLDMLVRD